MTTVQATGDERIEVRVVGRRSTDAEFTTFVQDHQHELLRTAWLLSGDPHRAEELTQQALERTYVSWGRAREGDPLAYARRVLVNLRIATWRRRRREVLVAPEDVPETAAGASDADRHAERDRLLRALVTLPPRQRRVVVLRHLLDLPEAEVAAELSISVGTVKSTNARALARLRNALGTASDPRGGTP
ncbi:MAG: SigE family RNA polymerase sigma factor [Actinomycetales bacterium]|nr:SigE family RNA polymerase sigma factor [Actinomycetales bacterium]